MSGVRMQNGRVRWSNAERAKQMRTEQPIVYVECEKMSARFTRLSHMLSVLGRGWERINAPARRPLAYLL